MTLPWLEAPGLVPHGGHLSLKVAGITLDWASVMPVDQDVRLPGGQVVPAGSRYLPAGRVVTKITANGKYGPYESGATDGRELLVRGSCYILLETVLESSLASDHPKAFDGGIVYRQRLEAIPGNPSFAELAEVFTRVGFRDLPGLW